MEPAAGLEPATRSLQNYHKSAFFQA